MDINFAKKVKLMKTIYFILLIFLMSPEALIHASNSDSNPVVVVVTPSDNDYSGDHIDDPEYPYRKPAMKMYCNISQESGITFSGSGIADEIVSYEIYDITGSNIAIFSDEQSFIDFIFSGISGEYLLRFRTPHLTYLGIISIL